MLSSRDYEVLNCMLTVIHSCIPREASGELASSPWCEELSMVCLVESIAGLGLQAVGLDVDARLDFD